MFTPVFEGMTFTFAEQIVELSKEYRVITYFLDNLDSEPVCAELFALDLIRFMDHLGLENVNVVTMCVTTSVPLYACYLRPDLFASFFITNAFIYYPMPKSILYTAKLSIKLLPDKLAKKKLADLICSREEKELFMPYFLPMKNLGRKLALGSIPMADTDIREEIRSIKQRALILTTSRDPMIPVKYTRIIASNMPNAEFKIIKDERCAKSHFLSLSAPTYYMRKLRDFLEQRG